MIFRLHQNDMLRRSSRQKEMINRGKFPHLQLPSWHWPNVIWYFSFPSPSSNDETSKRFKYSNKINYVLRGWDVINKPGSGTWLQVDSRPTFLTSMAVRKLTCVIVNMTHYPWNVLWNIWIDTRQPRMSTHDAPRYDSTYEPSITFVWIWAKKWTSTISLYKIEIGH